MAGRKTDIEKYLRGELTPSEMHALEKEALQDPFLAEALEGIDQAGHDLFLYDLKKINRSVKKRSKKPKAKIIFFSNWSYGVAASVLLVAASAALVISILRDQQKPAQLALNKEKDIQPIEAPKQTQEKSDDAPETKTIQPQEEKKKPAQSKPITEQSATKVLGDDNAKADEAESKESVQQDVVKVEEEPLEKITDAKAEQIVSSGATANDSRKKSESAPVYNNKAKASVALSADKSETKLLSGKVTSSEDGAALPGVNVIIKGTTIGTVTDVNGNYQLPINNADQTLVFNFIGLQTQEVKLNEQSQVDVSMNADTNSLSEVVVTGFSRQTSEDDQSTVITHLAVPEGGRRSFQDYLQKNLQYPKEAQEKKIEGRVTVQFTVDISGALSDFKVVRSLGAGCDEELIRLIKEGPKWKPTTQNDTPVKGGVKVRLKFTLPK
jgi:TonB family protein